MTENRRPVAREHELVGHLNPRCLRCRRTLLDLVVRPAPCRPVPAKAALEPSMDAERERA